MNDVLWRPDAARIQASRMERFRHAINQRFNLELADYAALHQWSIDQRPAFWQALADEFEVIWHTAPSRVLEEGPHMPDARWFPGATLNVAEHLLRRRDQGTALVAVREDGQRRTLSHAQLAAEVAGLQRAFKAAGIGVGDRVAACMPNTWQTLVAMLAATSLGAIWSSASPDFGIGAINDRFGQIEPKLLLVCAGYQYAGKSLSQVDKINEVLAALPTLDHLLVVPHGDTRTDAFHTPATTCLWDDFYQPGGEPEFVALPFDHPLYILYSSGTTGVPKCIVHSAGGVLLQHLKEHGLHNDLGKDDCLFYYTTCG